MGWLSTWVTLCERNEQIFVVPIYIVKTDQTRNKPERYNYIAKYKIFNEIQKNYSNECPTCL